MGYRSDMKALVYPPSGAESLLKYEQLKTLMNTTFKNFYEYWQDPHFTWDDEHRVLKFSAESIKWYDSYSEVATFPKFLDEVHELGYEWEFIRLGENDDDVESIQSGDAEGFLYVQRSIEVSF